MRRKRYYYYSFLSFLSLLMLLGYIRPANASIVSMPAESFATLPSQYLESKAQSIQQAFDERATVFLKGRNFQNWQPNKPKQDILKEFEQLSEWRLHTWYVDPKASTLIAREDFLVAQDLLEKGYYRQPNIIAFQYNQTDSTYNSSTIVLNGYKFLALEAPSSKTLNNFFRLLPNYHVTHLIRLTSAIDENGKEKSYPYWNNKLSIDLKHKATILNIPQSYNPKPYPVYYYYTDHWQDNHGFTPNALLKLIQEARKHYDPSQDVLACHCHAGVGRTGTFLAGFLLLNEIDRQIASGISKNAIHISIEKIVMQLCLQRPFMVGKPSQYVTLYRLVDLYIQNLK